jgi:hypothetical protein
MANNLIKQLGEMSVIPADKKACEEWFRMADAVAFLERNARADEFVIYATAQFVFMHTVFVPISDVAASDAESLLSWGFNASSSWSISTTLSEPPSVSISKPLEDFRGKCFKNAEQFVFARFFEGHLGDKSYFEILQKFLHISDLHLIAERNSYCRLDERGDVEECIRIIQIPEKGKAFGLNVVTCKRELLDRYAALTDSVMVRTFDFTRYLPSEFNGWSQARDAQKFDGKNLKYHLHVQSNNASFMRGVQIIEPQISKAALANYFAYGETKKRRYESFIAQDWKNDRIVEISCEPDKTANYFTKSNLPFELSPAFSRPEVLLKYKADTEKYQIRDRTITCRGTWYLDSIDINEAGQVHAYICDLRDLPYEEQLHWKAYNEPPKASLSKRAITNDFEGNWHMEYDPLVSLKELIRKWTGKKFPWWTLRNEKLPDLVHYPVTSSADEWADELLHLDQLVVEGFEEGWLKDQAKKLGRTPDIKFRSLKLVEECFMGLGIESEHAYQIMTPLQELHTLRSKLKGHASGEEAVKIKQRTIKEFKSYKNHFRKLCGEIDKALNTIEESLVKCF